MFQWREIVVYHFDGEPERTGFFLKDEAGCGAIVEDFDSARSAIVPQENVRRESELEAHRRTSLGYLAQDAA
jgi:hypothetical protein